MTAITTQRSVIEQELKSIWDARPAEFTPARVVEAATPDDHPLHGFFEWDDSVAGAAYRCAQAAQLIRSVKITLTSENGDLEDHQVRAWLPARYAGTPELPSGVYVPTERVESPEQRALMLQQLRREAAALKRRYGHLSAFWSVLDDIAASRPAEGGEAVA